jgi:hypothetical protein
MNGTEYCADFRRIPMGDIDLQRELRLNKHSGVADYQREQCSVRRVYSAKLDRGKLSVTVATYQGDSAEEVRRIILFDVEVQQHFSGLAARCCEIYGHAASLLCNIAFTLLNPPSHPNIVQLCATASSGNIYAIIFHDGAIYNFLNGDTEKFNVDLIPVRQFLELHRQSHLAAAYVYACTVCTMLSTQRCILIYLRTQSSRYEHSTLMMGP